MAESIENRVSKAISNHRRGKIFFPKNFLKYGSSAAVRKALDRLEDKKVLVRLAHGIYLYPKKHKLLGILRPTMEEIAIAIAKRDKARIIPTGINALNKLGLSTQVPMKVVYLTDGAARTIKVGKTTIKFKKASPKLLSAKSETNVLVIQALREIGKDNLDDETLEKVKGVLRNVEASDIRHDMQLAPAWIAEIMKTVINE